MASSLLHNARIDEQLVAQKIQASLGLDTFPGFAEACALCLDRGGATADSQSVHHLEAFVRRQGRVRLSRTRKLQDLRYRQSYPWENPPQRVRATAPTPEPSRQRGKDAATWIENVDEKTRNRPRKNRDTRVRYTFATQRKGPRKGAESTRRGGEIKGGQVTSFYTHARASNEPRTLRPNRPTDRPTAQDALPPLAAVILWAVWLAVRRKGTA